MDEEAKAVISRKQPGEHYIPTSANRERKKIGKTRVSDKVVSVGEQIFRKIRLFSGEINKIAKSTGTGLGGSFNYPIIIDSTATHLPSGSSITPVNWDYKKRLWASRRRKFVFPSTKLVIDGITVDYREWTAGGKIDLPHTLSKAAMRGHLKPKKISIRTSDILTRIEKVQSRLLFVIILDTSLSMSFIIPSILKFLTMFKLTAWRKKDKICLIGFAGGDAKLIIEPTTNINTIKGKFSKIKIGGGSPLASALLKAQRIIHIEKIKDPAVIPIVLVITEGLANIPLKTKIPEQMYEICPIEGFADTIYAAHQLKKREIPIIAFNPLHEPKEKTILNWSPAKLLQEITKITKGVYVAIPKKLSKKQPDKILNTILIAINQMLKTK